MRKPKFQGRNFKNIEIFKTREWIFQGWKTVNWWTSKVDKHLKIFQSRGKDWQSNLLWNGALPSRAGFFWDIRKHSNWRRVSTQSFLACSASVVDSSRMLTHEGFCRFVHVIFSLHQRIAFLQRTLRSFFCSNAESAIVAVFYLAAL